MCGYQKLLLVFSSVVCAFNVMGQLDTNKPRVGYVYPAGMQRGQTIQVLAGGQFLRGTIAVYVSGEGVNAKVIKHVRPFRNLNGDQRKALLQHLKDVRNQRLIELPPKQRAALGYKNEHLKQDAAAAEKEKPDEQKEVKLPVHPLLDDLESKSLPELAHIAYHLGFPRNKLQQNRQLGEIVLIEITVKPDAKPGPRELRIHTKSGLTNPMAFQVGLLPEVQESEPNDENNAYVINAVFRPGNISALKDYLRPEPMPVPVVVNGQIMPGDKDRFRFYGKTGQNLVIETQARSLIPYLADAVPGWFQATATLYNAAGDEMAFADDYRFNPDPVLFYKIPRDGIYELEIRDSIYRGRQDFVYRVAIGELPFITHLFPWGGKEGVSTVASVDGWNLTSKKMELDTQSGGLPIRKTMIYDTKTVSNLVPYGVSALPEETEVETNNTVEKANKVGLGKMINGRIDSEGDVDVFAFEGKAKDRVVAEVYARRLNSPLDSILRLTESGGTVLGWNDDHVLKDSHLHKDSVGLMTHHADSYLMATLPKDGTYYVHLTDTQNHGSRAHGYRLRLTKALPHFELRVTPSGLNFKPRSSLPVTVHVMRKDGFDGEIEVALKDAPAGFEVNGNLIPAGCDRIRMTVTAPPKAPDGPVALIFEGIAKVEGQTVRRQAVGADDVMQAFLYRHLVPAEGLLATVQNLKWASWPFEVVSEGPVKIPTAGTAEVKLKTAKAAKLKQFRFSLHQPPEGLSLDDVKVVEGGLVLIFKVEKNSLHDGFRDNLIVEIFREGVSQDKKGKSKGRKYRNWLGVLPAVPIQVVGEI